MQMHLFQTNEKNGFISCKLAKGYKFNVVNGFTPGNWPRDEKYIVTGKQFTFSPQNLYTFGDKDSHNHTHIQANEKMT